MPRLILHYGTPTARTFELKTGANFIGRDAGNDIAIDDISVSGSHTQVVVEGASAMVMDLGSSNGTFIDREPVVEATLQPGQFLRLGGVEMFYEADDVLDESGAQSQAEVQSETTSAAVPVARIRVPAPVPAAPAALSAPPLAPRIPSVTPAASGPALCKFHPRAAARWQCPQCGQTYCELCVTVRRTPEGQGHFCRPCSVPCAELESAAAAVADEEEGNFYTHLPGAFLYPFKSGVGFVLVVMAVFFSVVSWATQFFCLGFAVWICILGYIFVYMQKIIQSTVQGENHEPPMPDVSNFVEDLMLPFFQLLGTFVFSFLPAIGLAIWHGQGGPDWTLWAIIPALGLGCLYFPMAFLGMATFDTIGAAIPTIVVPAILKIPLEYLTACFCLAVVLTVRLAGAYLLSALIPIPIVPYLISDVIGLYFLAVQCRILGLLYYTNRYRLGWMKH